MILILVIVVLVVILGVIGGLVGRFGFGCWLLVGRGIGDSGFWTGGDSGVSGSGSSVFFDVS